MTAVPRVDVVLAAMAAANTPGPHDVPYPESMRPIARACVEALDAYDRRQRLTDRGPHAFSNGA